MKTNSSQSMFLPSYRDACPSAFELLLGTDLPGIGFAVHYRRQEDGVWFPTSLGSEFRIHVLFFFNRSMSISMENKNFERTHVESKIVV